MGLMKNLLTQWELRRKTDLQAKEVTMSCLLVPSAGSSRLPTLLFGIARPSRWRSNHRGSGPLELKPSGASHRRCDVNKRHENRFGGRKNNRLMIGKKPPNPAGTGEENRGRKDLVVVQSSRINLCDQWCIELFARSGLHLGDLT